MRGIVSSIPPFQSFLGPIGRIRLSPAEPVRCQFRLKLQGTSSLTVPRLSSNGIASHGDAAIHHANL